MMTGIGMKQQEMNRVSRFWAVVRYELLWNLRKKKILVVLIAAAALEAISLSLTPMLLGIIGQSVTQNPDYVVSTGMPGFILFFFGMVVVMNSISGEFESGTIVPLLTKPVSRTTIFLGKLSAALLTLIPAYVLLFIIEVIGGTAVYGPQNDLYILPVTLVGLIVSTLVWMAIVLAIGSVTKSSVLAAIVSFAVYFGLLIGYSIISAFSGQSWVLAYLPGTGNSGYLIPTATSIPSIGSTSVSTGTDSIASSLVSFILHPSFFVAFVKMGVSTQGPVTTPVLTVLYTEPLSYVLLSSLSVALVYIFVFLFIAWFALRQAQVAE
ncbi:MAG: ABC transporter permease [Nitrososphaerota archaeon]|nr:ABC transporter permease [Nitrososphaerota archaeon]